MGSVLPIFTDRARKALHVAAERATSCGRSHAAPEDVLWALANIEVGPGRLSLERLGINIADLADHIVSLPAVPAAKADLLIQEAYLHAQNLGHSYIGTEHLALAVLTSGDNPAAAYLRDRGVSEASLRAKVKEVLGH